MATTLTLSDAEQTALRESLNLYLLELSARPPRRMPVMQDALADRQRHLETILTRLA